jgi:hypothetical protein
LEHQEDQREAGQEQQVEAEAMNVANARMANDTSVAHAAPSASNVGISTRFRAEEPPTAEAAAADGVLEDEAVVRESHHLTGAFVDDFLYASRNRRRVTRDGASRIAGRAPSPTETRMLSSAQLGETP